MSVSHWTKLFFAAVAFTVIGAQASLAAQIEDFFGLYKGTTISSETELKARDLDVTISKTEAGFSVQGSTVIYKASGREKKVDFSMEFVPSHRQNTWGAAMRRNMFGAMVPLDPLKGEPFVWANLVGDTLKIHALIIPEDGGYELQVYDRTLTDEGIDLVFNRFRDGEQLRTITGSLKRVPY